MQMILANDIESKSRSDPLVCVMGILPNTLSMPISPTRALSL